MRLGINAPGLAVLVGLWVYTVAALVAGLALVAIASKGKP